MGDFFCIRIYFYNLSSQVNNAQLYARPQFVQ